MQHNLSGSYWDNRYEDKNTGWDVGDISTPLKNYIDQLTNKDIAILVPGCGNAYEADYLLKQGFTNITLIDISPVLISGIQKKFAAFTGHQLRVIWDDFFNLQESFDLILEQTFFCALDPALRKKYAAKMFELLKPGGKLAGVLFNRNFEGGPPFGGNKNEYEKLFQNKFEIKAMEDCYNSIGPRNGSELFINLVKN